MKKENIKKELIKLTKDLIKFKTTSDKPEEVKKCMKYIKDYLKDSDVIIKEYINNNKRSLYISYTNSKKPKLLLNGHIDVVPCDKEQYIPIIKDNKIYGRGAVDMKAGVAAYLLLIKELSKLDKKPNLGLMIVSDEEIGGFDGTEYLIEEKGYSADFVIAAEPGHVSEDTFNIITAEKGVLWLKIKTKGKSCHGSRPWLGENAIEKIISKVQEIKNFYEKTTENNRWKTTVNLGTIKGGDTTNKVPEEAEVTLDIRYTEENSIQEILEKVNKISDIEVEVLEECQMLINPDNTDIINLLKKVVEEYSGKEVKLCKEHGASDLRFTSSKGIPSVIFGPYGSNYHGKGEYVSILSLEKHYKALKLFIIKEIIK